MKGSPTPKQLQELEKTTSSSFIFLKNEPALKFENAANQFPYGEKQLDEDMKESQRVNNKSGETTSESNHNSGFMENDIELGEYDFGLGEEDEVESFDELESREERRKYFR